MAAAIIAYATCRGVTLARGSHAPLLLVASAPATPPLTLSRDVEDLAKPPPPTTDSYGNAGGGGGE